jgi:hypothetical protein
MMFDYDAWLKTAEDRLETLYEQKASIEAEITALEEGIEGFAPLVKKSSLWYGPETGITDAVKSVLKADPTRCFTPTEIRDTLYMRGTPLTQRNPMANIHQVLARLVEKQIARILAFENGRNRYQWAEKNIGERIMDGQRAPEEAALEVKKAVKEMRENGSEVGTTASLDSQIRPVGKLGTHRLAGKR